MKNADENDCNKEENMKMSVPQHTQEDATKKMDDEDEDEATWCPLFMDGLPQNFASNPALAALASLMEDDEEIKPSKPELEKAPPAGGGKARKSKSSRQKTLLRSPYSKQVGKSSDRRAATMGEAQLFLNMW
eukprot:CAMPEP_0198293754 /NCGR_PEP_ID=MMETSP1449-20131203/18730_1 /TAXON_ID=420275 /ORGANISM="Attheya septentrionalis, Strain CCMP2084" /LENGTH=131 /DNA_ID=CAMNT_0043993465 /DNA_START=238 /DNA_END=630 /DNA_ORIENTATION=+